ncbi:MAG: hypothetical protein II965_03970 [Pyramidobacter sp.]|nr:hypothetical protein [Pyramidobacter sp.]
MKKNFFVVLIWVSIAAATAHAGIWHVDNKGQLREWSGSTDPIRTPPSGCGQIYSVEQKNNDVFVHTEKGTYQKLSGTWKKLF